MRDNYAVGISALAIIATFSGYAAADAKPNVVLIMVDDLGFCDLGYMGNKYIETPNVDALASESMRFNQAYTSCSVSSPTRCALMTGKNPAALGIKSLGGKIPQGEIMLPQVLREAGYYCGAVGKWHIGVEGIAKAQPVDVGFDFQRGTNNAGQPASYFYPFGADKGTIHSITDLAHYSQGTFLTDALAQEACRFITDNRERPFFLYLSLYAVHIPISGKPDKIAKYEKKQDSITIPKYAALVESMDDAVGRITTTLKELKLEDNTIVIFITDNGGYAKYSNNKPLRAGKGSPYEGGVRTPMLIRWPSVIRSQSACSQVVTTADIAPTIADIAGAKWNKGPDWGVSMLPVIANPKKRLDRDDIHWLYYPVAVHYNAQENRVPVEIIRSGGWKLIHFMGSPNIKEHFELYNLEDDISESCDLAQKQPQKRDELVAKLTKWRSNIPVAAYDEAAYTKDVIRVKKW